MNADICEVIDKKSRTGKLIFLTGGYAAIREKTTEIEASKSINTYDLIIVGSPIWADKITPAIRTFLTKNGFSDKQVAFFVTMEGNKPKKALKNMKKTISPKSLIGELGITNAPKNQ